MEGENVFNIQLVREIAKYPYLYNFNLSEYTSRDTTEKAWAEIGEKFQKSTSECKSRWKNLRGALTRNLNQRLNTSGHKVPKPFYLMKHMKFLLPFAKSRRGYTYDEALKTAGDAATADLNISAEEEGTQEDSWDCFEKENVDVLQEDVKPSFSETSIALAKNISISHVESTANDLSESQTENFLTSSDHNDADKHFLLSLLPHVHGLNGSEKLQFQIKTLNTINEIISKRENIRK